MKRPFQISGKLLYQVFLHVTLVVLAIEVLLLTRQENGLELQEKIKVGEGFTLSGIEMMNGHNMIDSTSQSIIFVFTTSCPFCMKSLPYWKLLASMAQSAGIEVLGVSIDSREKTTVLVRDSSLSFPVANALDPQRFSRVNHLPSIPETILRSKEGIALRIWSGPIEEKSLAEVVQAISDINLKTN